MRTRLATSSVLWAALPALRPAAAQAPSCSRSPSELCIDPEAAGDAYFDFLPMFGGTQTLNFVYAFQMGETSSGATAAKAGFWVEYEDADLDQSANQETYMAFLMVDGDGLDPDEGPWPCDGVLDDDGGISLDRCSVELQRHFILSVAPDGHASEFGSLPEALSRDNVTSIPFCPDDIISRPTLVAGNRDLGLGPGGMREAPLAPLVPHHPRPLTQIAVLAREDGGDTAVIPPGDFSSPWAVEVYDDVTYEEQLRRVAVAIALQVPLPDGDRLSPNQIRFSMSCARASADYEFPWLEDEDEDLGFEGDDESRGARGGCTPGLFSMLFLVGSSAAIMGGEPFA